MVSIIRVRTGTTKDATITLVTDPWGPNEQIYNAIGPIVNFKMMKVEPNTSFVVSVSAPGKSNYVYQGNISDKKVVVVSSRLRNCKTCV